MFRIFTILRHVTKCRLLFAKIVLKNLNYSFWTGAKVAIQRGKSGAVEFADLRVRGMQGIKESWVIVIREGARASGGIRRRSQGATVKHRDELGLRGLGGLERFKIWNAYVKGPLRKK